MPINLLEKAGEFVNLPLHTFADALPYNDTFPYQQVASLEYIIEYLEEKKKQQATGTSLKIQSAIIAEMKMVQAQLYRGEEEKVWEELSGLLEILFPEFLEGNSFGFASLPFARSFVYETPGMRSFQDNERYSITLQKTPVAGWADSAVVQAGGLILNTFYNQQFDFSLSAVFAIRDHATGLVKYKRLQASNDYFRIKPLKPLPALSPATIKMLLQNFDNSELWLQHLPPSHFSFEGIVFGRMMDVTASEVNVRLKDRLLNPDAVGNDPHELISFIEQEVRNYLSMPRLKFGLFQLPGSFSEAVNFRGSLLEGEDFLNKESAFSVLYLTPIQAQHPCIVEDLNEAQDKGPIEEQLLKAGYRGIITAPLVDERKKTIGVIELASPVPNQINAFTLLHMKGLFSLFNSGFSRFRRQWLEQINQVIQEKFTTIHHSLYWKFERVAADYLRANRKHNLGKVVFQDLIPLYGQADIIASTYSRNRAAHQDLMANFQLLQQVLKSCKENLNLHLLDNYLVQTESYLDKLQQDYSAADEPVMTSFLTEEVHPFLRLIKQQQALQNEEPIEEYFNHLHPEADTVYGLRQQYDDSLQLLNLELGQYLEREEKAMQQILPHYFSMFKTDGIEYNIYLGQSILQKGTFSDYHRKNFELWQLQCMIGITRMSERLQNQLPMPLKTAQLIFAYGSPISIQFRMDEKQFDIEGGVNISYEILKKRIDKAVIESTGERLTQAGKIAVVYLNKREHKKYMDFLTYLAQKGYLEPEIESFQLAPLQGVNGLKALRAQVTP
jgi:hypothetical protein